MTHNGWLPKKSVKGDHVFITGGGSGIGRGMARRFVELGASVTIADLDMDAANKTVQIIEADGFPGKAQAVQCDVSNLAAVKAAAHLARDWNGPPNILINNAGFVSGLKILDIPDKLIEKTIQVNTIAHHYTIREFLPDMLKSNKGHIVTVASMAGTIGTAGLCDYCASKFGAFGLDEALRMELKKLNSRVLTTCVCPYFIDTGMFEGAKSRFNFILPVLKEKYAVWRIITAIRQNEVLLNIIIIIISLYCECPISVIKLPL